MKRRHFLAGLVGLVAAPMVVRAAALMPVKAFKEEIQVTWFGRGVDGVVAGIPKLKLVGGEMMLSTIIIPTAAFEVNLLAPYVRQS